jgi:hypothetical protein
MQLRENEAPRGPSAASVYQTAKKNILHRLQLVEFLATRTGSSYQIVIICALLTHCHDFDLARTDSDNDVNFAETTTGALPFVRSTELHRTKEVL